MTTHTEPDQREQDKRAAAKRAAEWIRDGMALGLGTGSTVHYLLEHLARRRREGEWQNIVGVPTSEATERTARKLGVPLCSLNERPHLDLTIDGADEIGPSLDLIKGLGGALLREKIVATASDQVVIIADGSKLVARLGEKAPLPVEVEPFGFPTLPPFFRALGAEPELRCDPRGEPFRTDGGHFVFDCHFAGGIPDAKSLARELNGRPGVLEHGLFLGLATHAVVAEQGNARLLRSPDAFTGDRSS